MKKTIVGFVFTFVFALLTGCAAAPSQPTNEQMYGVGVSTQSRQAVTYTVSAPQPVQPSRFIPYSYVGQPNVVHYLDTSTVANNNYTVPVQPVQVSQPTRYYTPNNNPQPTYTYDNYGNRVVANNSYNTNSYRNQNNGIVYVAPTTSAPAYGYEWRYHNRYGWGWYHPQYGWYMGWR